MRGASPPRYQPLVPVVVAVALGIGGDLAWPLAIGAWLAVALAGWLAWLALWRRGHERWANAALLVTVAAIGGGWHHARWRLFHADDLGLAAALEPVPACVEGRVADVPRFAPPRRNEHDATATGERTEILLSILQLRESGTWRPASGRCRLVVNGRCPAGPGDRVRVFGQLAAPLPPMNPGEFDFAAHQRADRVLCRLWAADARCVSIVEPARGWSLARVTAAARDRAHAWLARYVEGPSSHLAAALLLGSRELLDDDDQQAYFLTGMIHVLSISGLHVGILAGGLLLVARWGLLGRRGALAAVALVTLAYAVLIQAEPPAVRATIIVLAACLAMASGRPALAANTLAAAALVVLALNPCDLFRTGPQLSFLCAAVLSWCAARGRERPAEDPLDRLIATTRPWPERLAQRFGSAMWQATIVSGCIWLVSLPLVMRQFHLASPVAIVLTPVLAVPIAISLLSGFGVLVFGGWLPGVAALFGWLCRSALGLTDGCVRGASQVAWGHYWVLAPPLWWAASCYLLLAWLAARPVGWPRPRWGATMLACWSGLGLVLPLLETSGPPRLQCTFISVGHGCAVLVQTPGGQNLLYDAGRMGSPTYGARSIAGVLWSRGVRRLDAVVVSHADADHYNALPELLERFRIRQVYFSEPMARSESATIVRLRQTIAAAGVSLSTLRAGTSLPLDPACTVDVLHPPAAGMQARDNADSLVLTIGFAGQRVLLAGDLESPGLERLLGEPPLDCAVALAPHHGSARSDPPGFCAWSTPEWVVISGDRHDRRPGVEQTYRQRGAEVLNTATHGAITATLATDGRVSVEWFCNDAR